LLSTLDLQPKDPVTFLQRIYQETAGNPLFVIEMAQAIQHLDLERTPELPIPSTIQGVIRARLSRLKSRNTSDTCAGGSARARFFCGIFAKDRRHLR
jgi:predicted ATPase